MNRPAKIILGLVVLIAATFVVWNAVKERRHNFSEAAVSSSDKTGVPVVEVASVVSRELKKNIQLPGEISAYEDVAIYPKVQGFVESIRVDRGSKVQEGELLARLDAPELIAHMTQAEAKLRSAQDNLMEAKAKFAVQNSTYQRIKSASMTPGVVAGNDVVVAEKTAAAFRAQVQSSKEEIKAARDTVQALKDMTSYLNITAPFNGIITERNVHPGSFVGPGTQDALPMLRIQLLSRLRLTVAVPEKDLSHIPWGDQVNFTVPAFPDRIWSGTIRRIAHSLDVKTRTMPVELDVSNESGELAPGMYAQLEWPMEKKHPSLFVPSSSIVTTTERVFVIRIRNGAAEWINIKRGEIVDDWTEVFGGLHQEDEVVLHGSDELCPGTPVTIQSIKAKP